MDSSSSPQTKTNRLNEKNSIKLYLEACLNRKVEKFTVKFFDLERINLKDIASVGFF